MALPTVTANSSTSTNFNYLQDIIDLLEKQPEDFGARSKELLSAIFNRTCRSDPPQPLFLDPEITRVTSALFGLTLDQKTIGRQYLPLSEIALTRHCFDHLQAVKDDVDGHPILKAAHLLDSIQLITCYVQNGFFDESPPNGGFEKKYEFYQRDCLPIAEITASIWNRSNISIIAEAAFLKRFPQLFAEDTEVEGQKFIRWTGEKVQAFFSVELEGEEEGAAASSSSASASAASLP